MGLGSFIVLIPTIVWFGIKGVLVVCIIEAVAYRSYLRILASRERNVPFHDHIVVFGSSVDHRAMACMHWASPTLTIRLGLIMLGIGMLLAVGHRSISEMILAGHQIMLGELKRHNLRSQPRCPAPLHLSHKRVCERCPAIARSVTRSNQSEANVTSTSLGLQSDGFCLNFSLSSLRPRRRGRVVARSRPNMGMHEQ